MSTLRQIGLLLWKNLTLRKRHYIVTICEILLPALFAIAVACTHLIVGSSGEVWVPEDTTEYFENEVKSQAEYYPETSQAVFLQEFAFNFITVNRAFYPVILYTPKNDATDEIIRLMNITYLSALEAEPVISEWAWTNCSDPETVCQRGEWRGVENELQIEDFALQYFNELENFESVFADGRLTAAIIFTSEMSQGTLTPNISYTLRFPSFYSNEYNYFIGLQIMLDMAVIEVYSGRVPDFDLSVQPIPYPPYEDEFVDTNTLYSILIPQIIIVGFLFAVPSILRIIVNEKETGVHELLTLMGLPKWMHWLGYMINSILILVISIVVVIAVLFIPFNSSTGAVFQNSDPSLWLVVLLLFIISLTSFCFCISTFFHKPALAITAGIVLYLLSYYPIIAPLELVEVELGLVSKLALCLIPNMAIHYAIYIMTGFEMRGGGAQWRRIGENVDNQDPLVLYQVMLMFIVNTAFYLLLSMYLERVIPSPYGLRKPWYYIFLPSEWGLGKKKTSWRNSNSSQTKDNDAFEKEPHNGKVGIEIQNLTKEFDSKVAVDIMSLKMYEGQITALLGQNGAGKTTTMSILTGMFAATSGTAYVNGYNITTEMEKVRKELGLCPQHNMLFNRLTVMEHLVFFARLKGSTVKEAKIKAESLIAKLRLEEKKNEFSMSLSGGQKRKLSLGCALIAGSKVVMLDEPTSGLDVENRRMLWDTLLEFREGRTIILTTHFMEEADALGDRIAIMDQGKLICAGTPMFLKNYYGTGYVLKLTLNSLHTHSNILKLVQSQLPEATFSKQGTGNSHELGIAIPTSNTSKFPQLFSYLSSKKVELGIESFGLAQTTMDDVFVRVGEISQTKSVDEEIVEGRRTNNNEENPGGSLKKIRGSSLVFQQILSLLKKKLLYTSRRKGILVFQLLIPILLTIIVILVTNTTFRPEASNVPLTMTLSSYNNPITLYTSSNEELSNIYESVVGSSVQRVDVDNLEEHYVEIGTNDLTNFREQQIIGAVINDTHIKAMHSLIAFHGEPLTVNIVMNTLFRQAMGNAADFLLEVTSHPFVNDVQNAISLASEWNRDIPIILFSILIPIGLSLVVASFVILPIEEKNCSSKQLQLMTGVDCVVYWLSSFMWDLLIFVIVISFMTVCFPILEIYNLFTSNGGGGIIFLILLAYGFETIPLSYLISLRAGSVAGGFSVATILHVLTIVGFYLITIMARSSEKLEWVFRFFPSFDVSSSLGKFTEISFANIKCNMFPDQYRDLICQPTDGFESSLRSSLKACCEECGQEGFPECFQVKSYLTWEMIDDAAFDAFPGDIVYTAGIVPELMAMFIMGIVYMTCLIIIERGYLQLLSSQLPSVTKYVFARNTNDEDVLEENNRVEKLVSTGKTTDDALVVNSFCKSFGSFSAVSQVSFGVHHGECFGLLGVNGAGKTTAFRILTGDEVGSAGNAYSHGKTLNENRQTFLKNVGYCPQFDGIIGVLTGNEMLTLFAGLRGIPHSAIDSQVSNWMSKMGLKKSGEVRSGKYSGGMKRRLSSAMAMIGEPQIILLDEPTTGVDSVARREFWKTITTLRNAGQAIVLTSHSMEECEKLCTRLAIMVNGEFQCLGGVQHLKDKFAKGYSLTLKLKFMAEAIDTDRLNLLKRNIEDTFQPSVLKDEHQNVIQYHLGNIHLEWSFLFGTMEKFRSAYVDILDDYAINQTTLEEVFLSFARQQYSERKTDVSYFKNFGTSCLCCKR